MGNFKKIIIDGNEYKTNEKYLMDALLKLGFEVPHLCKHPNFEPQANCRLCLVKINGKITTSCNFEIQDGIDIVTNSKEIVDMRKTNLQLILANHPNDCDVCVRNKTCELQNVADKLSVEISPSISSGNKRKYKIDRSSNAIQFDPNYCILCGRCIEVCKKQNVDIFELTNRGFDTQVSPAFNLPISDTNCISCGQCVLHCPTGALHEHDDLDEVLDLINDDKYFTIAQVAPSIRTSLGEAFDFYGNVKEKIPTALKTMGFDAVVDTSLGADFTIMEEAHELIERIKKNENLPMFTSCCPAWVNYVEFNHHDLIKNLSTSRSPQMMLGILLKKIYSKKKKIPMEKIKVVSIMPCTAKKIEARRIEMRIDKNLPVDYVLTTRETSRLLKQVGIDLPDMPNSGFDNLLKTSSSAGEIFGTTGGVMEAALRSAYYFLTGENPLNLEFKEVRGFNNIKISEVDISGTKIRVGVVSGVGNFKDLFEKLNQLNLHFVEVMACPGGCISGGGQPQPHIKQKALKRKDILYGIDEKSTLRFSHENPVVKKVYEHYLDKPLSKTSEKLLHTRYYPRNKFNP